MQRCDARGLEFERVEVLGFEALITDSRVDPETLPDGYFMYELRGSNSEEGLELVLEFGPVVVDFEGTLLSRTDFRQHAPLGYLALGGSLNYLGEYVTF